MRLADFIDCVMDEETLRHLARSGEPPRFDNITQVAGAAFRGTGGAAPRAFVRRADW